MQIHRDASNGDGEAVVRALDAGVPVDMTDSRLFTPLMLAVSSASSNIHTVQLLLEHGANPNAVGGEPSCSVLEHALRLSEPQRVRLLLDAGANLADEKSVNTILWEGYGSHPHVPEVVELLLERGALKTDPVQQSADSPTVSPQTILSLLAQGQDLNDLDPETRASILGLEHEGDLLVSREDFEVGRQPRFGTANPERMDVPFWRAMVQSGATAYAARKMFVPDAKIWEEDETAPIWSYHRSGKSITSLPDGRLIEIGGGHEDWYDPDFYIYNEVFVHHPNGHFDIFGYPPEVFAPTDFHSATLAGGFIYIIGGMGHMEQRIIGHTSVYRLDVETLAIERVETGGKAPGCISMHKGTLVDNEIHVCGGECTEVFILNLDTHYWRHELT